MNDIAAMRSMTDATGRLNLTGAVGSAVSGRTSNCVRCQAAAAIFGSHARLTALAITGNFRATAIRATFDDLNHALTE